MFVIGLNLRSLTVKKKSIDMKNGHRIVAMITVLTLVIAVAGCGSAQPKTAEISLPTGFQISIYASGIEGARSLTLGENGVVFVGSRDAGRVYALVDEKGDGAKVSVITVASNLDTPNGVAFYKGSLYVAEVSRILRYDHIMRNLSQPPEPVVVVDNLPRERHHGWKFIAIGPDEKLYVPIGAPCNICKSEDERFASIMRMNLDGSEMEIFARGVRNAVGFAWDPITREFWFTDNGRDWLGDNLPPDELNHAPIPGMHFGYPYYYGDNAVDPEFKEPSLNSPPSLPAMKLGAHVAPLGMRFYTGPMFPSEYRNQIFIAEHGSWNRTSPTGYRISLVRLQEGKPMSYEVFAQGWLQSVSAWGRPVDVLVMPDGALLVSDDRANAVYRISYQTR
ncbi:MAG: putative rane-bound dehydrogenase domain protein [Firmicutes bacterium]|nr:putative rane-bound dehydrogenase domain protein [Bacillota bacterium]